LSLANTNLINAEENLRRITLEENRKVENARVALLSTGLTTVTSDIGEDSTPPEVSGSYLCKEEGTYEILVYSSGGDSGYSYTYTGPESGTASVGTEQPAPLGSCGLYLKFTTGDLYNRTQWKVEVPNTRSANYITLKNNLILTSTQAKNTIALAENNIDRVKSESSLSTAPARREEVTAALANVNQAEARVAAIDAKISDRSIISPFDGVITQVSIAVGENAPLTPVINVLNKNSFTLKARVPEIDITKIINGQKVQAIFDAKINEPLTGTVTYISPVATIIDGVAYFESTIEFDWSPDWLRAGLNADVDIITQRKEGVLRLPKRFVITLEDGSRAVLLPLGNKTATTTIEVLFTGNDSFVEVSGLPEGTLVVAP
jgi:HlyD family secretion protein